jgi:hypothetical protein
MKGDLFKKFLKFIDKHGHAETAYLLGYRDTNAIKKWVSRGSIPKKQIVNVESMLKNK